MRSASEQSASAHNSFPCIKRSSNANVNDGGGGGGGAGDECILCGCVCVCAVLCMFHGKCIPSLNPTGKLYHYELYDDIRYDMNAFN